jgi:phage tail sheath protein FI
MPTYLHPGVYLEELPAGVQPIQAVGTSTAAFVGFARQGPIGTPQLVTRWDDYQTQYGGIFTAGPTDLMGLSVNAFFANGGGSAYIVRLTDGATTASVFLLDPSANQAAPAATDKVYRISASSPGGWGNALSVVVQPTSTDPTVVSISVQSAAPPASGLPVVTQTLETCKNVGFDSSLPSYIEAQLLRSALISVEDAPASDYMFGQSVSAPITITNFTSLNGAGLTVTVNGTPSAVGFNGLTAASGLTDVAGVIQSQVRATPAGTGALTGFTATVAGNVLTLSSGAGAPASAVVVTAPTAPTVDAGPLLKLGQPHGGTEITGEQALPGTVHEVGTGVTLTLAGGGDGQTAVEADYQNVFDGFLKLRDIDIICLPGTAWDEAGSPVVQAAIAHAETARSRMVIIDPPAEAVWKSAADVDPLSISTSTYAALYYPWLSAPNPAFNVVTNPTAPRTVSVPPSGFAAGMWARIDSTRGVWKAPAGTETALLGLSGVSEVVEDAEQDGLNPDGVNCIRQFPGYGTVIWGARTRAKNADPQWRYIPVRRTAIFIEQSIYNGIQWAVFEPNGDNLWAALRASAGSFMDGLFRQGAFQGETATDAYFVNCGLGSTMSQGDIDSGQVTGLPCLRLVVLAPGGDATAPSADTDPATRTGLAGLAPAALEAGVPAVVAMRAYLDAETEGRFISALYGHLVRSTTGMVDQAVNDARQKIFYQRSETWRWTVPVLFMSGDGKLFTAPTPAASRSLHRMAPPPRPPKDLRDSRVPDSGVRGGKRPELSKGLGVTPRPRRPSRRCQAPRPTSGSSSCRGSALPPVSSCSTAFRSWAPRVIGSRGSIGCSRSARGRPSSQPWRAST